MPEVHFATMPIVIEYMCDNCGTPVVAKGAKIKAVGVETRGLRHECPNPECAKEYFFQVSLPFIQHGKIAPIVPARTYINNAEDEN